MARGEYVLVLLDEPGTDGIIGVVDENRETRVLVFDVEGGELVQQDSWVYVWLHERGNQRGAIYVGATGMDPRTRAWLHLHHEDPEIGRILARYQRARTDALRVVAIRLPNHVSRHKVRNAVTARLDSEGLLAADYVGHPVAREAEVQSSALPYVDELVGLVRRHVSGESSP